MKAAMRRRSSKKTLASKAGVLRGSKFGNVPTIYNGVRYDSKREAEHAKLLDVLKRAKNPAERVVAYRRQVPFEIVVNGKKICTYKADFVVRFADGRKEVHDPKGFRTATYRLKKKLVEAVYGIQIKEF